MPLDVDLDDVLDRMQAAQAVDRRAEICACGHPMGKHTAVGGGSVCSALRSSCRCRKAWAVLKAPNARLFSYRTDEFGAAVVKGAAKTNAVGLGHRLEWIGAQECAVCGVDQVNMHMTNGGREFEWRCGEHR